MVNVRSPSYLKQNTFEYCLWGVDYIFIYSFLHEERFWINFPVVIRENKCSVKCSWSLRNIIFPSPQRGQVRAMLGDPENLIFAAQKFIYSFFTLNLVLPEEFLSIIWAREMITIRYFLVSWKIKIWLVNHESQVVNSNPGWCVVSLS